MANWLLSLILSFFAPESTPATPPAAQKPTYKVEVSQTTLPTKGKEKTILIEDLVVK